MQTGRVMDDRIPGGRPVGTYSIVARDDAGALGVAVQSHWFNVGAVVPWVEAGVGAVAVQSISDPSTGERALGLLRSGKRPDAALAAILDGDADAAYRQIAIVDANGDVATHTGELCISEAGHRVGDGYSAQANIMDRSTVWAAMTAAFGGSEGDLVDRLLDALDAAEAEGGDARGRQSAAILVLPDREGDPSFDLRVEDSPDPLQELRRLVTLQRSYNELNRGDRLMAGGEFEDALASYERAAGMIPDAATDGEAAFWAGVAFATTGRVREALPLLRRAAEVEDRWARLLPRLARSRMLPNDPALLQRLLSTMER